MWLALALLACKNEDCGDVPGDDSVPSDSSTDSPADSADSAADSEDTSDPVDSGDTEDTGTTGGIDASAGVYVQLDLVQPPTASRTAGYLDAILVKSDLTGLCRARYTVSIAGSNAGSCTGCVGAWTMTPVALVPDAPSACDPATLTGDRDLLARLGTGGDLAAITRVELLPIATASSQGLNTSAGLPASGLGSVFSAEGWAIAGLGYVDVTGLPDEADALSGMPAPTGGAASLRNAALVYSSATMGSSFPAGADSPRFTRISWAWAFEL